MTDRVGLLVNASAVFCINVLKAANVVVFDCCEKDAKTTLYVARRAQKSAVAALTGAGRKVTIIDRRGLAYFLKCAPARAGILVGFLLTLALGWYYSTFIFTVDIKSTDVTASQIIAALSNEGLVLPQRVNAVDCKSLEYALCRIEGVSHATVVRRGSRLAVTVLSEFSPQPITDLTTPTALVATRDAIVTGVVATSGTALVKVGDIVRAGQVLIAPYIKIGEENTLPCAATGNITGTVIRQEKRTLFNSEIRKIRTGESERAVSIVLGVLKSAPKASTYSSYEVETKRVRIAGVLPLYAEYYTYFRTEPKEVACEYSDGFVQETEEGFASFASRLPEGSRVVARFYEIKRLDNYSVLELYYQTEENIYESKNS